VLNVPEIRQQLLLERLANGDQLVAQELADEFGISLDTIRRDIIALEQQGKAQRVRGGAVATSPVSTPLQYRAPARTPAIDAIATRALREIDGAKTLLLDGGSTVLALSEKLQPRAGLLVMTPSPWIAVACQKNGIEVFMLGGRLSALGGVNVGDTTLLSTATIYADVSILGVCGIDSEFGLSADDLQEAHLKRAMSHAAERTLVLASQEKIGRRARYQAVPLNELACLITDAVPADLEDFDDQTLEIIHA